MSYIFGTSNDNYFSSLFGSTSSSGTSSFFGGVNNMLGDYSMIKSGTYKKLITAYYKTQDSDETGKTGTTSKENSAETAKVLNAKTDASTLFEAASKLNDTSLYESTGKDEEGNAVYNTEKIKDTVKNFVNAYNSYIDSTSEVDNTRILNKSLSVVKETASNQKLLKEVGITIGEGNKLVLDEEKLASAYKSTLTSLFTGRYSYADQVSDKASQTYQLANSATYTGSNAYSYTYKGSYATLGGSTAGIMDQYL